MITPLDVVLDQLEEYLEQRQDVVDGDYGVPAPNEEMTLLRELKEVREALAPPVAVSDAMVERYVEAVNAHLGGMSPKDWEIERFDQAASVRRVARIGLTAALTGAQP